jgi:tryptophanyl-tRNA synthetase
MYPVLMGADILMFNAHQVPVGRDQVQHIEIARDLASSFNHRYGEHFVLPEAAIEETVATLPGLDGRKMSKSYDNAIPLFATSKELTKLIGGVVTDSRAPGEPKVVEGSALFQIYQAFATEPETASLRQAYAEGIGWADAKQILFERVDRELAPMRETYTALINNPARIETILQAGAEKARALSAPFAKRLRDAVGLRDLRTGLEAKAAKAVKVALPHFKQYREADATFHFKFNNAQGHTLLQGGPFLTPKEAAQVIRELQLSAASFQATQNPAFTLTAQVTASEVAAALQQLNEAVGT